MLVGGVINLSSGWGSFWGNFNGAVGGTLTPFLATLGVAVALWALGKWLLNKVRGQDADVKTMLHGLMLAAALSAPVAMIPLGLGAADLLVNGVAALLHNLTGA